MFMSEIEHLSIYLFIHSLLFILLFVNLSNLYSSMHLFTFFNFQSTYADSMNWHMFKYLIKHPLRQIYLSKRPFHRTISPDYPGPGLSLLTMSMRRTIIPSIQITWVIHESVLSLKSTDSTLLYKSAYFLEMWCLGIVS